MQTSIIENRDILDIINNSFENVDEVLDKYFDQLEFEPMVAWISDYLTLIINFMMFDTIISLKQ